MSTIHRRGLRLLSFDGGGPRALSQLLIVNELMKRLQVDLNLEEIPKPCHYFDMIIGVGLGGLVALLLGRLGMTAADATNAYIDLSKVVFEDGGADTSRATYRSRRFESAFKSILRQNKMDISANMEDQDGVCKTVVCVTSTDNLSQCTLLRSYRGRSHSTVSCTVLEAACATIASPNLFKPVRINGVEFVNGGFSCSNPLSSLLREAQEIFGRDTIVSCLLSIGVGKGEPASLRSLAESTSESSYLKMCMDADKSHEEFQHRFHQTGVYFRFNVEHGLERQVIGEWKEFGRTVSHTTSYLQEGAVTQRIDLAVQSLHVEAKGPAISVLCSPNVIDSLLKVRPSVSRHFVGRETVLKALFEQHFESPALDISGPNLSILSGWGGAGKTQISLRFSDEYELRYPNRPILFLDARSKERLEAELEEFIRSRGPVYRTSSYSTAISYLSTELPEWLIILDNADDPSFDLLPYFPRSSKGSIIMTTRNEQHGVLAPHVQYKIEQLATEDAIRLLLQTSHYPPTQSNLDFALEIVEEVGCLALAVAQAAGYIFIHKCLHTYLSIHRQNRRAMLSSTPRIDQYRVSLYSAIFASFGKLSRAQQNILRIFSCLHFPSIPEFIISRSAERGFQYMDNWESPLFPSDFEVQTSELLAIFCPSGIWSEFAFNELIGGIQKYGLLQVNIIGDHSKSYTMHLLIQNFLHDQMDTSQEHHFRTLSTRLWSTQCSVYLAEVRLCQSLLPHALASSLHSEASIIDMILEAHVLDNVGNYQGSLMVYETAKILLAPMLSQISWSAGFLQLHMAFLHLHLSNLEESEVIYRAYLDRLQGENVWNTSVHVAMNQVTAIYIRQSRYQDAYHSARNILETIKNSPLEDDIQSIKSMSLMARAAQGLGKIDEAMELISNTLQKAERVPGVQGDVISHIMAEMGDILWSQGNFIVACDIQTFVLETRREYFGEEHPYTFHAMGMLGVCLQSLKRYAEAEHYYKIAIQGHHKIFGPTNYYCTVYNQHLISLYRELGRHEEADAIRIPE